MSRDKESQWKSYRMTVGNSSRTTVDNNDDRYTQFREVSTQVEEDDEVVYSIRTGVAETPRFPQYTRVFGTASSNTKPQFTFVSSSLKSALSQGTRTDITHTYGNNSLFAPPFDVGSTSAKQQPNTPQTSLLSSNSASSRSDRQIYNTTPCSTNLCSNTTATTSKMVSGDPNNSRRFPTYPHLYIPQRSPRTTIAPSSTTTAPSSTTTNYTGKLPEIRQWLHRRSYDITTNIRNMLSVDESASRVNTGDNTRDNSRDVMVGTHDVRTGTRDISERVVPVYITTQPYNQDLKHRNMFDQRPGNDVNGPASSVHRPPRKLGRSRSAPCLGLAMTEQKVRFSKKRLACWKRWKNTLRSDCVYEERRNDYDYSRKQGRKRRNKSPDREEARRSQRKRAQHNVSGRGGSSSGSRQRSNKETGSKHRSSRETGSKHRSSRETGSKQRSNKETRSRQRDSRETGSKQRCSNETGSRERSRSRSREMSPHGDEGARLRIRLKQRVWNGNSFEVKQVDDINFNEMLLANGKPQDNKGNTRNVRCLKDREHCVRHSTRRPAERRKEKGSPRDHYVTKRHRKEKRGFRDQNSGREGGEASHTYEGGSDLDSGDVDSENCSSVGTENSHTSGKYDDFIYS